ncbi:GNAT family N-acetyltransferase [Chitinimonas lacunae]|uniref:GNAT family N-acetyltransferase n=1 Tax=Chitinimonas lacunae TaxID=1963018 RepID=A0ABV8MXX6_9NEIS
MALAIVELKAGDDLEAATRLFDQYRQFYQQPSDPAAARAYLTLRLAARQSAVYLALSDGVAVGFMQMYPGFCSLALAPIWTLFDLYVAPAHRGSGVASALLRHARTVGQASGAAYLQLSTARDNHTAQALYERHGWQLDRVFLTYTLPLDGGES